MSLTVVAGGQFGSEGKGKAVAYLASRGAVDLAVRCGSTNSGHTVWRDGSDHQLRMVPAAFGSIDVGLAIAAGALVDVGVLRDELRTTGVPRDRLYIDRNAMIIELSDIEAERAARMGERFGSTQSGVGWAVARRALRSSDVRLAGDVDELADIATVDDVSALVRRQLGEGAGVVIEGTQGYGLSLYHTPAYPYATSRDTTAAGFLSEVGVGPRAVDEVILAVRTYPIRVAGTSGPFGSEEITWENITGRSRSPEPIVEYSTVTQRPRRVSEFEMEIVRRAADVNSATAIALHGADYIDFANRGVRRYEDLTPSTREFIERLEVETGVPVTLIGVGPRTDETIDRRPGAEGRPAEAAAAALS